jgi:hypothetical protein
MNDGTSRFLSAKCSAETRIPSSRVRQAPFLRLTLQGIAVAQVFGTVTVLRGTQNSCARTRTHPRVYVAARTLSIVDRSADLRVDAVRDQSIESLTNSKESHDKTRKENPAPQSYGRSFGQGLELNQA